MKVKKLGVSPLEITTVGLGTWSMGGEDWAFSWGPQNDADSFKTIYKALDKGINWIDTAPVYGLGHSETIVGKALKGMSEKPLIATKCSRVWDQQGKIGGNLKRQSIFREIEDSLKRLQVDEIDLYQMHKPEPEEDMEEGWAAMAELVKQGKARYIGVSNFNVAQLELISKIHPVTSVQPPYSMLVRGIETDLLPWCKENNIGVICYSPMYKGLLTGKVSQAWVNQLHPDDHRKKDKHFQNPELEINIGFVNNLQAIADKMGITLPQLAIAWVIHRNEVTAAIVGCRKPEQIESTVPGAEIELDQNYIADIQCLIDQRDEQIKMIS